MKKPTDIELLEICKKYRCEDNSDDQNIQIEKQLGEFRLIIFIEFINDNFYNCQTCLRLDTYTEIDLEDTQENQIGEYNFEEFISDQINEAKTQSTFYEKLPGMVRKIEDFANEKGLNLEIAKLLVSREVERWI